MDNPDLQFDDFEDEEEIEAYCVRCREHTIMLHPTAVWTRRGTPGMRGECDICGSTIFRMGRTSAHARAKAPNMKRIRRVAASARDTAHGSTGCAAFINFSPQDIYFATRLAEDLERTGIPTWFDPSPNNDGVEWATGVDPGLLECSHMVVVLSGASIQEEKTAERWNTFKEQRKPVVVALLGSCDVPDALRRSPRFDFNDDYQLALRQMVQALST